MVNPLLERERIGATFDPERLTHLLDGGDSHRTNRRRYLESVVERDPTGVFDNTENIYLHRTDRHVRALAKHVRLVEIARSLNIGKDFGGDVVADPDFFLLLQAVGDDLPTSLHWVMFVPNIRSLADDEQQSYWLPLCRDWRVIGCYAQTELGHGSNIRALETTATFVPASGKEGHGFRDGAWRIHSPTLTSAKFWPGTLGRTANHAMVIARLIDGEGVDRGIHNFLVPLRSMRDHKLLKGVSTGDIGPKIGYNLMDNGFATFDNVMVPRRNMLMRFAHVDERGRYTKKVGGGRGGGDAAERVAYITMMQVRAYIVNEAGKNLAMACCVAVRYSAVRLQGYREDGASELQVLDYTQQQHRLFPLVAASYCFFFTGRRLLDRLREMEQRLVADAKAASASSKESSLSNGANEGGVSREVVTDIHASSSALKSFTTTVASEGMEDCRKACGGHGFLACSGLPELVTTYLQNPTVEGDNHMLPQQVARVLLKVLGAVKKGTTRAELESFYRDCDSLRLIPSLQTIVSGKVSRCGARSKEDLLDLTLVLLPAFEHRAARLLVQVATQLESDAKTNGKSPQQAWNGALVAMARMSRAYSQILLVANFVDGIRHEEDDPRSSSVGPDEIAVLYDLARLVALYWMERDLGDFCEDGYVSPRQATWVHEAVLGLLSTVRPNAVALVDARDFSDFRLKSALGRFDGEVYPAIMEAAKRDPLNRTDPGPGVEHIKRLVVDGVGAYTGTVSRL
jgi:acyl-CoA oxidase